MTKAELIRDGYVLDDLSGMMPAGLQVTVIEVAELCITAIGWCHSSFTTRSFEEILARYRYMKMGGIDNVYMDFQLCIAHCCGVLEILRQIIITELCHDTQEEANADQS